MVLPQRSYPFRQLIKRVAAESVASVVPPQLGEVTVPQSPSESVLSGSTGLPLSSVMSL